MSKCVDSPVLQWLMLPPLIVWFVTRQLTESTVRDRGEG